MSRTMGYVILELFRVDVQRNEKGKKRKRKEEKQQ